MGEGLDLIGRGPRSAFSSYTGGEPLGDDACLSGLRDTVHTGHLAGACLFLRAQQTAALVLL